jgi:CDP-glucose 4,6-dehydratase
MVSEASVWAGRRVLVTGHTGFKGGWLSLWLHSLGAQVTGYAQPAPTQPSFFDCAGIGSLVENVVADVRDLSSLEQCLRKSNPEVVFHLAAQSLVRRSYEDPLETYSTNVMGTAILLEAIRRAPGVRVVVVVTSDKCYENREWVWGYRESDALGGYDPYSNSKGCAELVTSAFRNSFFSPARFDEHGVAIASARAGNVIGGGDWAPDRLIPDLVRAIASGQAARIRNPSAVRPWQHVLEPVGAYLHLAEHLLQEGVRYSGAWNFGPDQRDAVTVKAVLDRVVANWGEPARWTHDGAEHPHEAHYLSLDCSKARRELGWRPRLNLDEALAWTVQWYKEWFAKPSEVRELSLSQIRRYCEVEAK